MADANKKLRNEDIVNELTKDLESSLRTDDTSQQDNHINEGPCGIEPSSDNDGTHPDLVMNHCSGDNKMSSDKGDNNTAPGFNYDSDCKENEENSEDDDDVDEVVLKDNEVNLTNSEKEELKTKAEKFKLEGNDKFKLMEYELSIDCYTEGLRICPLSFPKDRAMIYANRAAAKMKLNKNEAAIKDCTKAVELDPAYVKAFYRRAQCYEMTEKFDECLADFNKILELDPQHNEAKKGVVRLPPLIEERNEKLKTEMLGKLKDLGNMILRPFGLSTENFQMVQDPETKGYSINFTQNK